MKNPGGAMISGVSPVPEAWRRGLAAATSPHEAAIALRRAYARRKPQLLRAGTWRSRAGR